jgi:mediator of RNA polymerase II transcription subunit 13
MAPLTSISMLHIHVLATYCYPASLVKKPSSSSSSSNVLELKTVHEDVTKNFYELSVLAQARWKMAASEVGSSTGVVPSRNGVGVGAGAGAGPLSGESVNPILPMHLAMVDVMGQVADGAEGVEIDS